LNSAHSVSEEQIFMDQLARFFQTHQHIFVITGAGISTESGIPDYRDENGDWKRKSPITHQQFVSKESFRKRYWSRNMVGWKLLKRATPNRGHLALTQLETNGYLQVIVTQNVDGLHQQAGSQHVIDLHGNVSRCVCLSCRKIVLRSELQTILECLNPEFLDSCANSAPDGDADVIQQDLNHFQVPDCQLCGGILIPDVVFYGGSVPKTRVDYISRQLETADALLLIGSTMMTYSSFRYCIAGVSQNKPIAAINRGVTRADKLLAFKITGHCSEVLAKLAAHLIQGSIPDNG
jgi:NAD-dependent SIR2 family protein deacetylase